MNPLILLFILFPPALPYERRYGSNNTHRSQSRKRIDFGDLHKTSVSGYG